MAKMSREVTKLYLWLLFLGAKLVAPAVALPNEPYLLFSNLTTIGSVDLNNLDKNTVISGLSSVISLDVDRVGQKIYYGEHSLGEIYRVNMDGTNKELLLSQVGKVEGIAIDWVARLIYWTAYTSEKIEVATLDGKYRKILLNTGLEFPRGIAVDPEEGFLFWSDWGSTPAIERSTLAGGDRKALIKSDINWPNGITIDYANKRLYWIDAFFDTITSIDYDGGQRTKHFEDTSLDVSQFHGFDLDILSDTLYWTDWSKNSIFGLNYTTPNGTIYRNITIQTRRASKGVMGTVVIDSSRQPTVTNRCGSNNGGCQQLCLLEPNGFKCACAIGVMLAADGKSCEDAFKDEFIMFADGSAGKIYQLQIDSVNVEPVPIKFTADANISRPIALEFDPVEDRVYWTDVTLKIISRAFRNGTGYQTLFADKVGTADGLTVDLAGRNLYWTSTTFDTIEVSKLDGSFRRVLIDSNLYQPRDIIVDPVAGYMYWTDWGIPKIERAYMDGSSRSVLVSKTIRWPNGLTIDHVYNKLYWADAFEDSIEIYDLETGERDVIINEKFFFLGFLFRSRNQINHPFGLTLLNEYVYWTDWNTKSVYRAVINTGANITLLATGLVKPMDIHAYSIKPKQAYRKTYTFSFPKTGSNFTCIRNKACPVIPSPPDCPQGYNSSREDAVCGLSCRDIVGYTYRCQCRNWKECAVRKSYALGCGSGYYSSYRVRECTQTVKPGRCPYNVTEGSRRACTNDQGCPGEEKCCNGVCAKPASIATHPCQINNGGCDQLCLAIPGGHRCGCENNFMYNETLKTCVKYIAPPTVPPTIPSTIPANTDPVFSNCPNNISVPTDPGVPTKKVTWTVPTANDFEGKPANVTVTPRAYTPPVTLILGITTIVYTATDDESRTAYCQFSVEVKDEEPPSFGSTCPQDILKSTDKNDDVYIKWTPPIFKDNSNGQLRTATTGQTGSSTYPLGTTIITYSATDDAGHTTTCTFAITVINACNLIDPCGPDKICELKNDKAECVCKKSCTDESKPVCGSDGKTYTNGCHRKLANCTNAKDIVTIKNEPCGCPDLGNDTSSSSTCSNIGSSITCEVTCQSRYKAIFSDFLMLRCDGKRWIRGNNGGKYVPIKDPKDPPKCYLPTSSPSQTSNICPAGTELKDNNCVPCPPGSYRDETMTECNVCMVNHYQDSAGQTFCKECSGNMTSTTKGAESCYFGYGRSLVTMTFTRRDTTINLPKSISEGLTKYCEKATCNFTDTNTRRKKRASEEINFKEEHVVILSQQITNLNKYIVELFVLDPTSASLVPDKALSTKDLEYLLEMISQDLPFPVKIIDGKPSATNSGGEKKEKSKKGLIAGVIIVLLVVSGLAIAVFLYTHKRRQKRRLEDDNVPNVQFSNDGIEGGMQIGPPSTVADHPYENLEAIQNGVRHGFVNQVYAEVNRPPPYYATTPNGGSFPTATQPKTDAEHVYEKPVEAGALPVKEPLPVDGVVELIPPKQIDLPNEKSAKYDFPVKLFQKRSSENVYTTPRDQAGAGKPHYEQFGGAEASLTLEPPPKYDDAQLQFLREKTTSSILPNVPRKKAAPLDDNANQHGQGSSQREPATRSAVQDLEDVTKEQSES